MFSISLILEAGVAQSVQWFGLGLYDWVIPGRDREGIFSLRHRVGPMATGGTYRGDKVAGAWGWPLNLVLMLRMTGAIPPLTHTS